METWQIKPATIPSMDQRQDWVDYGKGIGILLVVYAHLLSIDYHTGVNIPEHFFQLSDSIIYSFHMPFFFLLSGLFVEESFRKRGVRAYLVDKFSRIAYPYVVWSIIQVGLLNIMLTDPMSMDAGFAYLLSILYRPWDQFWFLYVLLLMHLTYVFFTPFGDRARIPLLVISLGLFFYPLKINLMALPNVSVSLLFFICGMIGKDLFTATTQKNVPGWTVCLLAGLLIGSGIFIFENKLEPVRLVTSSHPFYFLYLSILGILTCTLLSQYLARNHRLRFLMTFGKYSLPIFLVHLLVGMLTGNFLLQKLGIQNWIIQMPVTMSVALAVPVLLYQFSRRIGFPYLFGTPHRNRAVKQA